MPSTKPAGGTVASSTPSNTPPSATPSSTPSPAKRWKGTPKTPSHIDKSGGGSTPSMSPGGRSTSSTTHRLGERQTKNGHTYELQDRNGTHQWVRVDKEKGGPGEFGGGGQPEQPHDPAKGLAFAKSQLGSIQGPIKGLLATMHQSGSPKQTFDPKHTTPILSWMQQNAGQNVGGGAIRDLGGGSFGFSSPAGAIVIKEEGGKHSVHFSTDVGPVKRAMDGLDPFHSQAPPKTAGDQPQQMQGAPPVQPGTPPAGAAKTGFEPSQANPEQMASMGALMQKPAPAAPRAPRPPAATPHEALANARADLETAVSGWQEALASGLSPQGNNHWKQLVAARKQIWQNHRDVLKEHERASKPGKPRKNENEGLDENEIAAKQADPQAFADLQRLGGKSLGQLYHAGIEALVKGHKHFGSYRPEESQTERNPPITGSQKPQWRHAERAFENPEALGKRGVDPDKGKAEREAMAKHGIEPKVDREAGRRGFEDNTKAAEAESRKFKPFQGDKLPGAQTTTAEITGRDLPARSRQAAALRKEALERGFTTEPPPKPKVPTEFETPAVDQLHGLKGKEPSRRMEPGKLGKMIKENAEQWDMKPHDYADMLREMHPEFIAHHNDREEAKQALREATGWNAGKVNRAENKGGTDSTALSKHDKLISAIAAQYPQHFGDDYMADAFDLLREGPQKAPGITHPDFIKHVHDFLSQNAGSAGGGAVADDDVSSVPFARVRRGFVMRYKNWLKAANAFVMPVST